MALPNEDELARLTEKLNEEFRTLGKVTPDTARAMMEAETQISNFNFKVELGAKVLDKLASAAIGTQKAMYKGEKGASAFNQSITDMSDAAQTAAVGLSLLLPGGPLMRAVYAGITYLATSAMKAGSELTKTANEQSDKLYDAFQKMSKAGAAGSDGMTGVFGDIQKLGLGIQDLDGYISLINDSSRDLARFGGSVTSGRKAFADMNAEMKPFTEQLYNAGLNQEDIAKGAMSYLKIQTQLGASQTMTSKQLADGAKKYLIEQDALTKLTGMSRADAEAAREAAMSEQRFAAKIAAMKRSSDPKERAAAEELIKANSILESQSKEAAQGFRDLSTGMITTEASQKALTSSNGEALTQATNIASGNATAIEGVQKIGTAFGQFAEDMNATAQAGVFEDFSIKFSDAVKLGIFAAGDLEEQYKKINEDIVAQGVTGQKARDALQQTQTDIRLVQKEAMQATQGFVQTLVGPATDGMLKLAKAANAAAQALGGGAEPSGTSGQQPLRKTGIEVVDKQMEKERASPEYAAYQKNQEKIKKDQEAAAKSWADSMPTWLGGNKKPEVPPPMPSSAGGAPAGGAPAPAGGAPAAPPPAAPAPAKPAPAGGNPAGGGQTTPPAKPASGGGGTPPVNLPYTSGTPGPAQSAPAQSAQPVTTYSDRLLNFIKSTERFTPTAFWDSQQWTNGYGTKAKSPSSASRDDPGPKETVDEPTAITRMTDFLQGAVSNVITYGKKKGYNWNQGQVDALTSFSYNAGIGAINKLTDGGKRSNEEIASKILEYNKAKNNKTGEREVVPGLVNRRKEELSMFQAKDGGVFDGPKSGYAATLHGNEAVIPLKDGAVPVSMSQEFNMTAANLGELVAIMKNNVGMQDRMLAVLDDIRRSQSTMTDNTGKMVAMAA